MTQPAHASRSTAPAAAEGSWRDVAALGSAQTLAWASSYYLPAMLAAPMGRDLGLDTATVFLAFSLALGVSALVGPAAGRAIDRLGGRPVLIATNLLFAAGLWLLATATSATGLFGAWLLLGLAMGAGLYEAAFAALVRLRGPRARDAITGITLIAGFASTVGWPLSAWMESQWGWRGACLGWAALHLVLGVPLNALLPRVARASTALVDRAATSATPAPQTTDLVGGADRRRRDLINAALLSLVFTIVWFISTGMAAHLPGMLVAGGLSAGAAVAIGALVGPAQVAGRLLEFGLLRRIHPLLSARLAALGHPAGVLVLTLAGMPGAAAFALLHGAGNGIMTIAKGTLPLVLFRPEGYGARVGWMMLPSRIAQAAAPVLFGLALARWGAQAMLISALLGLTAFAALMAVRPAGPAAGDTTA